MKLMFMYARHNGCGLEDAMGRPRDVYIIDDLVTDKGILAVPDIHIKITRPPFIGESIADSSIVLPDVHSCYTMCGIGVFLGFHVEFNKFRVL